MTVDLRICLHHFLNLRAFNFFMLLGMSKQMIRISSECLIALMSMCENRHIFSIKIGEVKSRCDDDYFKLINEVLPKMSLMYFYMISSANLPILDSISCNPKYKCIIDTSALVSVQLYNNQMQAILLEYMNTHNKLESLIQIKDRLYTLGSLSNGYM